MQVAPGLETNQGFEAIAIENGGMVIAQFHHHEQVERVGIEDRLVRQTAERMRHHMRVAHARQSPLGYVGQGRVDIIHQRADRCLVETIAQRRHLGCRQTVPNHRHGLFLFQPFQVAGQQCLSHAAQTILAVTFGAVFLVQAPGIHTRLYHERQQQTQEQQKRTHQICSSLSRRSARLQGRFCNRSPPVSMPISSSSR